MMKKKIFWSISEEEKKEQQGFLKIDNRVIASIAGLAALEVKGVAKLGKSFSSYIKTIFSKKIYHRGVLVEFKENELIITLYVIAKYGVNFSELTNEIQNNVRLALEKMTEITPTEVNVIIQKVEKI